MRVCFPEQFVVDLLRLGRVALRVVGPALCEAVVAGEAALPPPVSTALLVAELCTAQRLVKTVQYTLLSRRHWQYRGLVYTAIVAYTECFLNRLTRLHSMKDE